MSKLLVGSVFTSDENTPFWYQLQMKFLRRTTKKYEHVVFFNRKDGESDTSIFRHSEVIGCADVDEEEVLSGRQQSENHLLGIEVIFEYFRQHHADNYLLLDSDCFPIMDDWVSSLLERMDRVYYYDPVIAAPIRTENLDIFPHPCALFIRGEAISEDWVVPAMADNVNLLQVPISDTGCGMPLDMCYPLMRSNVINYHPIYAAIYNHMFYHHGCGSRPNRPRAVISQYFDHYIKWNEHLDAKDELMHMLRRNPAMFFDHLMGSGLRGESMCSNKGMFL